MGTGDNSHHASRQLGPTNLTPRRTRHQPRPAHCTELQKASQGERRGPDSPFRPRAGIHDGHARHPGASWVWARGRGGVPNDESDRAHPPGLGLGHSQARAVRPLLNFPSPISQDPLTICVRALPLRTPSATIPALQPGPGLVYLAGAYAWPGIPLLEGCVGSAKRAVDALTDDLALAPQSHAEGEVDWSQGRGSLIGRIWRWRRRELDVDVDVDT